MTAVPHEARGAAAEAGYELISDGVSYGDDVIITGLDQTVFHQQSITGADKESIKVSFPGSLNFGNAGLPVNMALPSISQTCAASISASSTGFFFADLPFYPCCNFGAPPVGVGHIADPSPVRPAAFEGNGLLFPEMVVRGSLVRPVNNSTSTRVTLPPITAPVAYNEVAAMGNKTAFSNNTTHVNIKKPVILSSSTYDFNANSSRINDSGIVERMWRNSHLAHLQDVAYEGDPSSPTWIAPQDSPKNTTTWRDMTRVLKHGLNMTQPGKYLTRSFWELKGTPFSYCYRLPGFTAAKVFMISMLLMGHNEGSRPL